MRLAWIGTSDERRLALRDRVARWRTSGLLLPEEALALQQGLDDGGRQVGPLVRIALFILTLLAFSSAMSMVMLVGMPIMMAVTGQESFLGLSLIQGLISVVVGIAAAELLLSRARLRQTGIEDALYLSGPFGLLFALVPRMPEAPPIMFALAAAGIFAMAGVRLRRGLWLAAAVACVVIGIGVQTESVLVFAVASLLAAVAAALTGLREWASPAGHTALSIITAIFPAAGFAARLGEGLFGNLPANADIGMAALVVAISFAGFLHTRWKALLYSSLLTLLVLVIDSIDRLPVNPEWAVVAAGAATVVTARVVQKRLAGRSSGLTSEPLTASELEVLEPLAGAAGGAAVATEDHAAPDHSGPVLEDAGPTDSSFGGGGATEKW